MYTGITSIPYTKTTSIHYQTLSKKETAWKINANNLSVWSLQGLLLLFLDTRDDFVNKNEKFYNLSIKKMLVTINGMSHQLFVAGLQARKIYPELKKNFVRKTLMHLDCGLMHVRALITYSMVVAEQSKKVVHCLGLKKHQKPVVILCPTSLSLKMQ